ncbi:hypothetical protein Slin_0997 [Spirosoma linguale DSM 74]|uniref:Uncharacterized protein n=1 Tax=Spirosoma linguale (strain ATCC 33905 / DSM 74 / LMG 10896 / Claus 1) TaxID=504472 RepID=D2QJ34_SPILD|nr:hypothetical protein Slin_0997 [Spirosoma linguale DSM 74]
MVYSPQDLCSANIRPFFRSAEIAFNFTVGYRQGKLLFVLIGPSISGNY